ncbi:MAG: universal stress protein [Gammaproteobacteria bacterium]|jgi:nucleotide-binding universal stress UspA family protein|nr:universal stress protein [Gammaproteobacteria bacterium]
MTRPDRLTGVPARVLLSTDLSARCDRALDRAVQLATEWGAALTALKVIEPPQSPDHLLSWAAGDDDSSRVTIAHQQLMHDLEGTDVQADLRLGQGDVADAVERTANETDAGLVVTGMARNETLGRFLLGSTVERLAGRLRRPLLVVRNRVRGPYQRIVLATDFSDSSADALRATMRLFPRHEVVLYHAYKLPLGGLSTRAAHEHGAPGDVQEEYQSFLARLNLPDEARERLRLVTEHGALATVLTRYVRDHDVELVAMGAHGRRGLINALLGSTASRLLHWLPCDTLIVVEPD